MASPITADWAGDTVSNNNLNSTTYGQGTSFPSTYNVTRLFWRSDFGRMYYNAGTLGSPVWEGADVPVGTINMYAGGVGDVPNGWLLCNGGAVSRTTYAQLFAVLDTEYGVGDGSTTFNVPDFVTTNKQQPMMQVEVEQVENLHIHYQHQRCHHILTFKIHTYIVLMLVPQQQLTLLVLVMLLMVH